MRKKMRLIAILLAMILSAGTMSVPAFANTGEYTEDGSTQAAATIQAQEERDHAMLMLQYLHNNGQHVELKAIAKPDKEFKDLMDPLKMALEHEEYVTSLINGIYAAASEVKDYRTLQFLDWFVKEQGEEEMNAQDNVSKMELFGGDPKGLYMLNSELQARVYSAPSLVL